MSDYYDYFEVDFDDFNRTNINDHFIGGPSIVIIGIISFFVVVMIIIAIHLFSKKLEDMECEGMEDTDHIEEIEPLPQYQEREILTEAEVNLSNYIQFNNTINTIPRDTMNIINRLNETSTHDHYARNFDNNNNNNNNNNNCNNNVHEENQEEEPQPSTSTIPVPLPEKENMPRIPPPCYDVALTQPRISNKGMIVLPQDPSFSVLPFISRNSSTLQFHSIRRNRERFREIFTFRRHHSQHSSTSTEPNDYRIQDSQITSSLSTSSQSSNSSSLSTISESESLNYHHHHRRHDSDLRISRSRLFGRHRHSHTLRRYRRRRLHAHQSTDNISVSSISVYYPTSTIDIPEDHYSIETHSNDSIRNYRASTYSSVVGRNSPTTTTINGGQDPDLSLTTQHLLSNISEYDTSTAQPSIQPQQNSSLEVLHDNESWCDIPHQTSTPSNQYINKCEVIQMDSAVSLESNPDNIASTSQTPSNHINIDAQSTNNNDSHHITIHTNLDPVQSNTNNTNLPNTKECDTIINVNVY